MALVDPNCFLGLTSDQKWQQIYEAMYSKVSDPTGLYDPSCFLGLTRDQQMYAFYAALYATIP